MQGRHCTAKLPTNVQHFGNFNPLPCREHVKLSWFQASQLIEFQSHTTGATIETYRDGGRQGKHGEFQIRSQHGGRQVIKDVESLLPCTALWLVNPRFPHHGGATILMMTRPIRHKEVSIHAPCGGATETGRTTPGSPGKKERNYFQITLPQQGATDQTKTH